MTFALVVSAIGSLIFALLVAGIYEAFGGPAAVTLVWILKVAVGAINIRIGHWKRSKDESATHRMLAEGV